MYSTLSGFQLSAFVARQRNVREDCIGPPYRSLQHRLQQLATCIPMCASLTPLAALQTRMHWRRLPSHIPHAHTAAALLLLLPQVIELMGPPRAITFHRCRLTLDVQPIRGTKAGPMLDVSVAQQHAVTSTRHNEAAAARYAFIHLTSCTAPQWGTLMTRIQYRGMYVKQLIMTTADITQRSPSLTGPMRVLWYARNHYQLNRDIAPAGHRLHYVLRVHSAMTAVV